MKSSVRYDLGDSGSCGVHESGLSGSNVVRDSGSSGSNAVRDSGSGLLGSNAVRDSGSSESRVLRGTACDLEMDSIHEFPSINSANLMSKSSMTSDNEVSEHLRSNVSIADELMLYGKLTTVP